MSGPGYATGGQRRRVQVARCGNCTNEHLFNVNTRAHGGMADDTIIRKLTTLGWQVRRSGRDLVCPDCIAAARSLFVIRKLDKDQSAFAELFEKTPPEEREEVLDSMRLEAVLDLGAPSLSAVERRLDTTAAGKSLDNLPLPSKPSKESTMQPEPPREPTREDKRLILDRLAEVYVSEEVGYAGGFSDGKVGDMLGVPPAWVKALREEFHGENGSNEENSAAAIAHRRAAHELHQDVKRIEAKVGGVMETLAAAERELNAVKAGVAKLGEPS